MGGAAPYTFAWSNGETGMVIENLAPDTYIVTLTDGNDCEFVSSTTITEPGELLATFDQIDILCFGANEGYLEVTNISGGTEPYDVLWENGATNEVLEDIGAGEYAVSITDVNGCLFENMLTISQPDAELGAIINTIDPDTQNPNNGTISLEPMGGTAPYTTTLDGINGTEFNNLPAGDYTATIIDANGCSWEEIITLALINSTTQVLQTMHFNLYPNPSKGEFNIELSLAETMAIEVQIADVLGRIIYRSEHQTATLNTPINIGQQATGVYWLSIVTDNGRLVERVVVTE